MTASQLNILFGVLCAIAAGWNTYAYVKYENSVNAGFAVFMVLISMHNFMWAVAQG